MSAKMIDYIVDEHHIEIDSDDQKRVKVSVFAPVFSFNYLFPTPNRVRPTLKSYLNSMGVDRKQNVMQTECLLSNISISALL